MIFRNDHLYLNLIFKLHLYLNLHFYININLNLVIYDLNLPLPDIINKEINNVILKKNTSYFTTVTTDTIIINIFTTDKYLYTNY